MVSPTVFSSGTQETTAILGGQLDAAYVGPTRRSTPGRSPRDLDKGYLGHGHRRRRRSDHALAPAPPQLKGQTLDPHRSATPRTWRCGTTSSRTASPRPPPAGATCWSSRPPPNSDAVPGVKVRPGAGAWSPRRTTWRWSRTAARCCCRSRASTTLLMVTQSFLSAHPAIVADLLKAEPAGARPDQVRPDTRPRRTPTPSTPPTPARRSSPRWWPRRSSRSCSPTTRTRRRSRPPRPRRSASACSRSRSALSGMYDLTELNTLLTAAGQPTVGS